MMMVSRTWWGSTTRGQRVLGYKQMKAKEALQRKSVSSVPPWPQLQALLPGSPPLHLLTMDCKLSKLKETLSPQVAFDHGLDHSNRKAN